MTIERRIARIREAIRKRQPIEQLGPDALIPFIKAGEPTDEERARLERWMKTRPTNTTEIPEWVLTKPVPVTN